jgi:hypothetical protein
VTTRLSELRADALERDGGCRWPGCDYAIDEFANPLQMAHLTHRGMGGGTERNRLDNVIMLCSTHHNCLDGRTGLGTLRLELNAMLKAQI